MDEQNNEKRDVELEKPQTTMKQTNIDIIFLNEVGQFGWYQFRLICLAAVVAIFVAFATNQFMFTAGRINTRCLIPECEDPNQVEFSPPWKENATPQSDGNFDNCQRFAPANLSTSRDQCPATLFNRDNLVSCEEFVYENSNTVVYDYNLACDEWRRSLIGTLRMVGTIFALPVTGYCSDRWGRRSAMVINIFIAGFVGVFRIFADTYVGFVVSNFFEAFGFGAFSCAYIMSVEIVGPRFRVAAAATISSFFATGQVILAALAWAVPYWRHLTLILYIPQFLVISYLWIMPENARWYLSKGRVDEAEKVLEDAARVNKREFSEASRHDLKLIAESNRTKLESNEKEPWLISLVFKNKPILIRTIVSPIWWISTMAVYYGLTINAVHMVGNSYVNFMLVAAVEIPGFWLAVLLMNTIGRRPVLMGGFWICAACMMAYIFIDSGLYALSLTLYLIGKSSISTVMVAIHLYTAEIYPTKYRHSLFAFSSMMGRLGHILAALTPALSEKVWQELPFAIFAGLALISGALIFLMPETVGSSLPDTMDQAINIGRRNKLAHK